MSGSESESQAGRADCLKKIPSDFLAYALTVSAPHFVDHGSIVETLCRVKI